VTDQHSILVSALPPSRNQIRLALIIALALLAAFLVTIPFRHVQLPAVTAFIPVVAAFLFINDLITAALLYAQFAVVRSRALLALSMGYLFTAAIIVPYALTFPDAFAPTGLLGAGLQSAVWLYIFWHLGLPPAVITYALLKHERTGRPARRSTRSVILTSAAAMVTLVCALTWLVTAGADILPSIMLDAVQARSVYYFFVPPTVALSTIAIGLLWWRRSSILDLWLLLVLWAWLIETVLIGSSVYRFSVVWYAGRIYGLLSSSFVLVALLSESTILYARLALSMLAQRREREGRLMTFDAMAAAIAHEIKQPLGAIVTNANAGVRWLSKTPVELDRARETFDDIAADGRRANEVVKSLRSMFDGGHQAETLLDANELIRQTVAMLRGELEDARIGVQFELAPELPGVSGHRGQLQQVLLNIVYNAADSMRTVTDRARVLRLKSEPLETEGIAISVGDSGAGIDSKNSDRVFDAFFTTKANGTGMGLAICRSIVDAHGGTLTVSPGNPYGSLFRINLPANG